MKKLIYLTFIIFTVTSCSNSVSCDGFSEKKLVKTVLKEQLYKKKGAFEIFHMENIKLYIDDFFDNKVKFELVRTTDKNDELKSCECAAKFKLLLNKKMQKKIDSLKQISAETTSETKNQLEAIFSIKDIDIIYKLQNTSDDKFVAQVYENSIKPLFKVIINLYLLEKKLSNPNNKGKILSFSDGSNKYLLKFIENDRIEIVYKSSGGYTEKEMVTFDNGKIIANNLPSNFPVKNDKIYILEKNIFKVYNPEMDNYDIYKK